MTWQRSSFCESSACIEVAVCNGHVLVRSSYDAGRQLVLSPAEWRAFLAGARNGEFDLPEET